jgi:hypothetical protein
MSGLYRVIFYFSMTDYECLNLDFIGHESIIAAVNHKKSLPAQNLFVYNHQSTLKRNH